MGLAYNRTLEQSLIPIPPDGLEDGHPVLSSKRWVPRRARCVHKQGNKKVELKQKSVLLPSVASLLISVTIEMTVKNFHFQSNAL